MVLKIIAYSNYIYSYIWACKFNVLNIGWFYKSPIKKVEDKRVY